MNATTMTIPTVTRKRHAAKADECGSACCTRCGGFLVDERCMDIGESLGGYWFMAMRCVQCGDVTDEVILRNRYAHLLAAQELVRVA